MVIKDKLNVLEPNARKAFTSLLKELERNIDVLYEIATIDEKTGVYNHKFFQSVARIEFEKAKRGKPLSMLIIDVDNFKKLNDTYGHFLGDKVLRKLAEVLKRDVRKYDIVARFGGEEFFIIFPETDITRAKIVSNRILGKIRNDPFLKKYKVTISGGLTQYKENDNLTRIKARADKALYAAKKAGKDRVVEG